MKTNSFILIFVMAVSSVFAQEKYNPTKENLSQREWFQNAKFGMFIHWGVYSMLGDGEWVLERKKLKDSEYQHLAQAFYPHNYNPEKWVSMAKNAGCKYICITTRHHDGFSMFDSKISDYNIVKKTPYNKDAVRMLADECRKQGIKLFFYYSLLDWHRNDYFPRGASGNLTGRTESGDWNAYIKFMKDQLGELLTNYGDVAGIWFDGHWDKPKADWQFESIYKHIHSFQPACLVGNNHHLKIKEGEDFQMFEKDLPGKNTTGFSADAEIGNLPLETCETLNDNWGYKIDDLKYKTTKELIHYLVKAAGNNSNFLLNVGPMADGTIPAKSVESFNEIGKWFAQYGETIHGTRGGMVAPHDWGVTTQKDNKLFVHILNCQDKSLYLELPSSKKVQRAELFINKQAIKFIQDKEGVLLKLPSVPSEIDQVVTIQF